MRNLADLIASGDARVTTRSSFELASLARITIQAARDVGEDLDDVARSIGMSLYKDFAEAEEQGLSGPPVHLQHGVRTVRIADTDVSVDDDWLRAAVGGIVLFYLTSISDRTVDEIIELDQSKVWYLEATVD